MLIRRHATDDDGEFTEGAVGMSYDWQDDAKGCYDEAIRAKRADWLVENIPGVKRAIGVIGPLDGGCCCDNDTRRMESGRREHQVVAARFSRRKIVHHKNGIKTATAECWSDGLRSWFAPDEQWYRRSNGALTEQSCHERGVVMPTLPAKQNRIWTMLL
jgi:hypothetical protein